MGETLWKNNAHRSSKNLTQRDQLSSPMHEWNQNMKIYFTETGCEYVNWINLAKIMLTRWLQWILAFWNRNFWSIWTNKNDLTQIQHHITGHEIKYLHTLSVVDWDHHYWHTIWGFVCIQLSVGATVKLHTEHLAMKALSREPHSCHLTAQTQIHEEPTIRRTCIMLKHIFITIIQDHCYYSFSSK
jgi:hypothetical protein